MKKDDLNKALSGYYRALLESSIVTGTVMHRDLSLSIMCMALFLTSTGLMLTQEAVPQLLLTLKFSLLFGFKALFAFLFLPFLNC